MIVEARVDCDGRVVEARVLRTSSHRLLDEAAVEAVSAARFTPARREGRPVESLVRIPIRFLPKAADSNDSVF